MRWIRMMETEHEVSSMRLVRRWQPMSEKDASSFPIHLGYHFQLGKSIRVAEVSKTDEGDQAKSPLICELHVVPRRETRMEVLAPTQGFTGLLSKRILLECAAHTGLAI